MFRRYDAIIVGGSFAGLAVASRLRGDVLLIDRKEIGTEQTSACGITLNVLESIACLDSVLQVYDTGFIHTSSRTIQYDLPYPFCAFDYRKLCQTLAKRSQARVLRANVLGTSDGCVVTDKGLFRGKCIIDASGWKAVLASSLKNEFVRKADMSFGIETVVDYQGEGLHFWCDSSLMRPGVGWFFPCGQQARIGVGSYNGYTSLVPNLLSLLSRFHLQPAEMHGGFFPCHLREATIGNVFLVGDAAGQCEPLTGFGIRPALYFGTNCGDIVQKVIDGEISLGEGLTRYEKMVGSFRRYYSFLRWAQNHLMTLPDSRLTQWLAFFSWQPVTRFLLNWHRKHGLLGDVIPGTVATHAKSLSEVLR